MEPHDARVDEILDDIDADIEASEPSQVRPGAGLPNAVLEAPVDDAKLDAILSGVLDTQQRVDALHQAWLAQQTFLRRHQFPLRWLLVVFVAMGLTWVFTHMAIGWP